MIRKSNRKTILWFAKDWDYLLVRLYQMETDGKEYQIMLKEGTIDGKTVTGEKELTPSPTKSRAIARFFIARGSAAGLVLAADQLGIDSAQRLPG